MNKKSNYLILDMTELWQLLEQKEVKYGESVLIYYFNLENKSDVPIHIQELSRNFQYVSRF
jgi:hypothetical protein